MHHRSCGRCFSEARWAWCLSEDVFMCKCGRIWPYQYLDMHMRFRTKHCRPCFGQPSGLQMLRSVGHLIERRGAAGAIIVETSAYLSKAQHLMTSSPSSPCRSLFNLALTRSLVVDLVACLGCTAPACHDSKTCATVPAEMEVVEEALCWLQIEGLSCASGMTLHDSEFSCAA